MSKGAAAHTEATLMAIDCDFDRTTAVSEDGKSVFLASAWCIIFVSIYF